MSTKPDQFCGNCGNRLSPGDRSCPRCGMPLGLTETDLYHSSASLTSPNVSSNPALGRIIFGQAIANIILFVLVIVLLGHFFTGGTSFFSSNPASGQTPTAPGPHIIYQADWSKGLDGWNGTADWQARNGQLVNDGTNAIHNLSSPTILVPFDLSSIANYAVEARIQVSQTVNAPGFGFFVRYNNNGQGYIVGAGSPDGGPTSVFEVTAASDWHAPLQKVNFTPGKNWHTYRIEVSQDHITVFIDGGLLLDVTNASYASGEFVGLWDSNAQLAVSSFVIESL
jgi:hypothetical protein